MEIVASFGRVDHSSWLYRFSSFDLSSSSSFITHVDSLIRIWHEKFGHLNHIYL
jgi:hypothetical protein